MLTDADRELIAAAVDGDLTPAQEATFRWLVATTVDAAPLFEAMKADARRLRSLPRIPAPSQLERQVIARIVPTGVSRVAPTARPAARRSRPSPNLLPYAVAASLLLGVAASTYWVVLRGDNRADALAQRPNPAPPADPSNGRSSHASVIPTPTGREVLSLPRPTAATTRSDTPSGDIAIRTPVEVVAPPRTTPPAGDVVASGPLEDFRPFETVQLRLPFLAPVSDLDRPSVRALMLTELADGPAFRLDLFTRDPHKAAEVFRAAAKSAGVTLMVEAVAVDRMRRKLPTAWAIYTEALSPTDIAGLLGHLAKATRTDKAMPFGTAHLISAQQPEQREVRELIGVDPDAWKGSGGASAPKPISAETADQVASALTNPSAGSEKVAILLSYLPPNGRANPAGSREVKAFLDRRGNRSTGAVPLLIVIRPAD